jgi:hypothetical protein
VQGDATKEGGEKKKPLEVLEYCADVIRDKLGARASVTYKLQQETSQTAYIEG